MHVLFVHRNFPAQFGHIASRLARERGWRCTFVSETPPGVVGGVEKIMYRPTGGATERTHYFSRTFENATWHAAAVRDALEPLAKDMRPDLIVGHSGFGSTLYLHDLFPGVPVIGYFEYFYRPNGQDLDYRRDMPPEERDRLRARARNAMILLDLEYCAAGYSPTEWQASLMPAAYRSKLRVIHDGIDTAFWRRREVPGRAIGKFRPGPDTRIVTYVSRGFESMRGFDVFMRMAKIVCDRIDDVVFLVVGTDRVAYGGDERRTGGRSFREHVLAEDDYDVQRIKFVGRLKPSVLARVLSVSDLHVYLTVPFVLSWSLLDAMSCGCVVLGSDTEPVREVIDDGRTGLLRPFLDHEALADAALDVLADPAGHRPLGDAAAALVRERYALDVVMPRMTAFYEEVAAGER